MSYPPRRFAAASVAAALPDNFWNQDTSANNRSISASNCDSTVSISHVTVTEQGCPGGHEGAGFEKLIDIRNMFFLFDSLLANKGCKCDTTKIAKNKKKCNFSDFTFRFFNNFLQIRFYPDIEFYG